MDNALGAIVLAGGAARRLGGRDKPMLPLAGTPLLTRVLQAAAIAGVRVVVGPRRSGVDGVVWTLEQPPGSGPRSAVAAGLAALDAAGGVARVLLLAADQPWVGPAVPPLLAALDGAQAAVVRQADGRRNPLASAWRAGALRRALDGGAARGSLQDLFTGLHTAEVPDPAGWTDDVDTPADLARARGRAAGAAGLAR